LGRARAAQGDNLQLFAARRRRNPVDFRCSGAAEDRLQIYTQATMPKMIAHCTQQDKSVDAAIDWAASELEGFMRA
jgi:hypothetical protein